MLPSSFEDGQFSSLLIQHVKTWLSPDRADAGEREIEPAREGLDPLAPFGRRREQQLVVVAPSRGAFQVPSVSTSVDDGRHCHPTARGARPLARRTSNAERIDEDDSGM